MDMFLTVIGALNEGFLQTLKLFFVTLIGALPLGLIISFGSMSRFTPLRWLTRTVVWIIRGTPLMLQLLILFFVPGIVLESGSPWPSGESGRFLASAIAFIINYACYFSEIFRGGIQGVPVGQQEAGQVLGMTKSQIFFHVTLLQMVKRIMPPSVQRDHYAGEGYLFGADHLSAGGHLGRLRLYQELPRYSGLVWPLFFTGVYYLVFNGALTLLFGWIEKKLSYFR